MCLNADQETDPQKPAQKRTKSDETHFLSGRDLRGGLIIDVIRAANWYLAIP